MGVRSKRSDELLSLSKAGSFFSIPTSGIKQQPDQEFEHVGAAAGRRTSEANKEQESDLTHMSICGWVDSI